MIQMVKRMGFDFAPEFQSWPCHLVAVGGKAKSLTSLSVHFLICKMGMMTCASQVQCGALSNRAEWRNLRFTEWEQLAQSCALSKWPPQAAEPNSLTPKCLPFTMTLQVAHVGHGMEVNGSSGTWWPEELTLCRCYMKT